MLHIAKMGNALTTTLRWTNLPAYEIIGAIPDSLTSNLDTMGIKSSIFGLVEPIGKPRYVKCMLYFLHPSMLASCRALSSVMSIVKRDELL